MGLLGQHLLQSTYFGTILLSIFLIGSCYGFLVHPKLLESRSGDDRQVLQVHSGLTLSLEKSSVLARNLHLETLSLSGSRTAMLDGRELGRNLYHNREHKSSLVVQRIGRGVEVRGLLSDHLRITPAVEKDRTKDGEIPHEVLYLSKQPATPSSDRNSDDILDHTNSHHTTSSNEEFSDQAEPQNTCAVENFTVEICVVVSTNYSSKFNTTEELIIYIGSMLNAMALRYVEMRCPRITFRLNKVWTVPDELVFNESTCGKPNNRFSHPANVAICGFDTEVTLNKTRDTLNACETDMCDIIYHLTSVELIYHVNGTFSTDILGMAEIGGACTKNKIAVGEDTPHTYLGLTTMAHEVGHLLGANHDDISEKEECSASIGYLMSTLEKGMKNRSKLSICSRKEIQAFVRNLSVKCIQVLESASSYNEGYPGLNTTKEAFCKLLRPENQDVFPSEEESEECEVDCCWRTTLGLRRRDSNDDSTDSSSEYYTTEEDNDDDYDDNYDGFITICRSYAMLDGMSCGNNKTCKRGVCGVHNWENITANHRTSRTYQTLYNLAL